MNGCFGLFISGTDLIHLSPDASSADLSLLQSNTDHTDTTLIHTSPSTDTGDENVGDVEIEYDVFADDLKESELHVLPNGAHGVLDNSKDDQVLETDDVEDITDLLDGGKEMKENEQDFYADTEGAGDSEKVGLLLASVAKKMCNISHQLSVEEGNGDKEDVDSDSNGCDELDLQAGNSGLKNRTYRALNKESPSMGRRLLSGTQQTAEEGLEQANDIEC